MQQAGTPIRPTALLYQNYFTNQARACNGEKLKFIKEMIEAWLDVDLNNSIYKYQGYVPNLERSYEFS